MAQIIKPALSKNGFLSVDEDALTLLVIDTVEKLETIEKIIKIYDKAYDRTITSIFKLENFNSNKAADVINKIIELKIIEIPLDLIIFSLPENKWVIVQTEHPEKIGLIENIILTLDQPISDTSLNQGSFTSCTYKIKHANPQRLEGLLKFIFKDNSGTQITVEDFKKSLIVFAHKSTHEKITEFLEILDTPNKEIPTDISSRVTKAKSEFDRRNDPMVAMNLLKVNLNRLGKILSEWTDKEIIFTDDAKNVRISIYAPRRIPRSKALDLIYIALEAKGFIAIHCEEAIYIEPKSKIDKTQVKNGKPNQE
jgi:hypothetical protein